MVLKKWDNISFWCDWLILGRTIVGLLIIVFLEIGLVLDINLFLKNHITFEQYTYLIIIVFIVFELLFYLKNDEAMSKLFKLMKVGMEFNKYKKRKSIKKIKILIIEKFLLIKIYLIAYQ